MADIKINIQRWTDNQSHWSRLYDSVWTKDEIDQVYWLNLNLPLNRAQFLRVPIRVLWLRKAQ